MARRTLVAIGMAAVLIGGCGSNSDSEPEATSTQSSDKPKSASPLSDVCSDKEGDGGPVDLVAVTVTLEDALLVTFDLKEALPDSDTALVGIAVNSKDGEKSKQLAAKWVDGTSPGPHIFDLSSTQQKNLKSSALTINGKQLNVTFPSSAVSDLGTDWTWRAFANAAGTDVDACPGASSSFENRVFPSE